MEEIPRQGMWWDVKLPRPLWGLHPPNTSMCSPVGNSQNSLIKSLFIITLQPRPLSEARGEADRCHSLITLWQPDHILKFSGGPVLSQLISMNSDRVERFLLWIKERHSCPQSISQILEPLLGIWGKDQKYIILHIKKWEDVLEHFGRALERMS